MYGVGVRAKRRGGGDTLLPYGLRTEAEVAGDTLLPYGQKVTERVRALA